MPHDKPLVRHEQHDGLAVITLANPPLNILTIRAMRDLQAAVEASRDAKVLLLRAEGRMFSVGADIEEHFAEVAREMLSTFHRVFDLLGDLPGVSVAAVDGDALGGGCELAVFCDFVLASDHAGFGQPESKLGVLPPVASALWPRIMGYKGALELIISGERLTARRALELGLVSHVYPADTFEAEVDRFVRGLVSKSRVMVAHAKRACLIGGEGNFRDALTRIEKLYLDSLIKSHDAKEGLKAFLEKREPKWKDE